MEKSKEEIFGAMDEARDEALEALQELLKSHPDAVKAVAGWWELNCRAAGHKRLAYALMSVLNT